MTIPKNIKYKDTYMERAFCIHTSFWRVHRENFFILFICVHLQERFRSWLVSVACSHCACWDFSKFQFSTRMGKLCVTCSDLVCVRILFSRCTCRHRETNGSHQGAQSEVCFNPSVYSLCLLNLDCDFFLMTYFVFVSAEA